ncbi:spore-associated protein A [Microtetraspora malaysiensis]|uniref:spore-associated protein A n=1 Tax=Microtetraspora malaysiensis TaxID=161358 RepID=UPI003D8BAF17
MRKSAKTALVAAGLAVGAFTVSPAPAIAAAYSPEGVCGAGYARVSDGSRAVKTPSGSTFGHVYLLYNSSNGYNCVVTIKKSYVGTATLTMATLQVEGSKPVTDSKSYKYYAGPVKASAKGKCVRYSAVIYDTRTQGEVAQGGRSAYLNCKK